MRHVEIDDPILSGKICPYCGGESILVDSSVIYGKSYGLIYLCSPCNAYCGVHKGTIVSLGRLANKELREMKKAAHRSFDAIWKGFKKSRSAMYKRLSELMGIPPEQTHIGMFDVDQCKRVIELLKNKQLWN